MAINKLNKILKARKLILEMENNGIKSYCDGDGDIGFNDCKLFFDIAKRYNKDIFITYDDMFTIQATDEVRIILETDNVRDPLKYLESKKLKLKIIS